MVISPLCNFYRICSTTISGAELLRIASKATRYLPAPHIYPWIKECPSVPSRIHGCLIDRSGGPHTGSFRLVYALAIFVNVGLTTLKIPHRINLSGVQTTLSKTGLPTDIVQKFYRHRPHGRAGVRDVPDRPETLTIAAALG